MTVDLFINNNMDELVWIYNDLNEGSMAGEEMYNTDEYVVRERAYSIEKMVELYADAIDSD